MCVSDNTKNIYKLKRKSVNNNNWRYSYINLNKLYPILNIYKSITYYIS